jgi:clan AA aspartic protease (TIGR02281 family)
MVLDTGSTLTMITPRAATEIGLDLSGPHSKMQVVGVAGSAWAARINLPRVSFMGIVVENLQALCYPLPSQLGLDGILGLNFLQHFNLNIDHDAETVSVIPAAWSK